MEEFKYVCLVSIDILPSMKYSTVRLSGPHIVDMMGIYRLSRGCTGVSGCLSVGNKGETH